MKYKQFGIFSSGLILVVSLTFLVTNSCKHEGIQASELDPVCFTDKVLPVFKNSCGTTGCHDANTAESGYVFTDYSSIMKAITPGNASKSKAYMAMTSPFTMMPPNNPLPQDKRVLIRLWIEQGAKETKCATTGIPPVTVGTKSGTLNACYNRDIQPLLMSSCAISGCHNAASHKEGVDFSSYAKTLSQLKAGNPASSNLYQAITAIPGTEKFMPPKPYSSLSKAAIDTIYSWIKRGALNEECAEACDTIGTIKFASHLKPLIDLYCVSCHGVSNPSGGIKLLTATDVHTVAKSGKLIGALKRKTGFVAMPPSYTIASCEVRQIELWIQQGYN